MINKRKVRLMTRTAMYEKHECSNDINKAKYYKSDYVGLHMTVMLIMIYAAMMTVFMIIAYFIYSYRYVESENGIRIYRNRLHKIYLMNKAERNRKGGIN